MKKYPVLLSIISTFLLVLSVEAQSKSDPNRNPQVGDIDLEEMEEKTKSAYQIAEADALTWLDKLKASIAQGGTGTLEAPTDAALTYLGALYIFCVGKKGICPSILDAVLESDVIGDKTSAAECPNMTRFWKIWVKNDFEKRAGFLTPIGNVGAMTAFNRRDRPKYIKCGETVKAVREELSNVQKKTERYSEGGSAIQAVTFTHSLAKELDAKGVNLYTPLDLDSEQKSETQKAPASKQPTKAKRK